MSIENRINNIDLNQKEINTDYRAALHKKLSELTPEAVSIKKAIQEDFTRSTDPEISKMLHYLRGLLYEKSDNRIHIDLSPLGPFGIDAFLTKTSPFKIAHITGRSADVVSDPTIQLTAEAYRYKIKGFKKEISLGTSHRTVRLQRYKDPSFTPTFEMYATLDNIVGTNKFYEEEKITNLIQFYYNFFRDNYSQSMPRVDLGNIAIIEQYFEKNNYSSIEEKNKKLIDTLPQILREPIKSINFFKNDFNELIDSLGITKKIQPLKYIYNRLPKNIKQNTHFHLSRIQGLGHYNGPVFQISLNNITLVDGGSVDWISKLTSNNREHSVVSGFGIELFAKMLNKKL